MRRAWPIMLLLAGCERTPDREFTLASANMTLPDDAEVWPSDILANNCGACHSAGMVLTQPKLKPEQWAATIKKMREVYRAPIADAHVPAILVELERLPAPAAAAATAAP